MFHNFKMNLEPGKTAVLFKFRGPGSKTAHLDLLGTVEKPMLPFSVGDVHLSCCVCYVYDHVGCLNDGDVVNLEARDEDAEFLILAGPELNEPIARYGPFVMNTREEIQQALFDYQNGTLA